MKITKIAAMVEPIKNADLEMLCCGFAKVTYDWNEKYISPAFSRVYFILDGNARIILPDKKIINLKKGSCYLIPAGITFESRCEGYMEQIFSHLLIFCEKGIDLLKQIKYPLEIKFLDEDIHLLRKLQKNSSIKAQIIVKNLFLSYIIKLLDKYHINLNQIEYSECVRMALAYIHSNNDITISLNQLSQKCYVSQTTLSKKFRKEIGKSVCKYIEELTLERGQKMLYQKHLSILKISEMLGFCDQFYFSKRFKQHFGESPQTFRKKIIS